LSRFKAKLASILIEVKKMTHNELLELLTHFFGWASLINLVYLGFATFSLVVFKSQMLAIHNSLFGLSATQLSSSYFKFLANYKIMTLVFFVAPYIALRVMDS